MIKMWNLRFCLETACNRLTLRSPAQGKRKDGNFCKRNASNAVVIFLRRGNFPALRNSTTLLTSSAPTGDGCKRPVYRTKAKVKKLTEKWANCFW